MTDVYVIQRWEVSADGLAGKWVDCNWPETCWLTEEAARTRLAELRPEHYPRRIVFRRAVDEQVHP